MTSRKVLAQKLAGYLWSLVALTFVVGLAAPAVQAQTSVAPAGAGTAANPYQVTQLGNLVWMSVNVGTQGVAGKYYKMMNDIDATDTANWNDNGTATSLVGFRPVVPFRGSFDGQGHAVSGLTINRPTTYNVGLFGGVDSGGRVSNLIVAGGTVTGASAVGGLAGYNDNGGTITNCHATCRVTGTGDYVGGLVGTLGTSNDTVKNCYATGAVSGKGGVGGLVGTAAGQVTDCYATGAVSGDGASVGGLIGGAGGRVANCFAVGEVTSTGGYVGGLVGLIDGQITGCYATGRVSANGTPVGGLVGESSEGTITNSYATGGASGNYEVGGLVGLNWGPITDCYAAGGVSGFGDVGGLVGLGNRTLVTSSYWDAQTSGQPTSVGGVGKTTAQMKQRATFVGWDFTSVWGILEGVTYPYFGRVQQPPLTPANSSPTDGATGVSLAPTLAASAFTDYNTTDTHAASQWQVRAAASSTSWTLTAFDSGATAAALTSCTVPSGALDWMTDYLWRVRYEDNHGGWNAWSVPTAFQTLRQPPAIPTAVAASNGAFADRVRIAWVGSPGASDYAVYRSTHPTIATATALTGWIDGSAGTSYDDLTAEPGVIYYYWVAAAADATGASMSGFSARVSGWAGSGVPFLSNRRGSLFIVY